MAGRIMKNAPYAVSLAKQVINSGADMDLDNGLKLEANIFGPVSYTHLDVYKRQDESVVEYDRAAARDLTASLDAWPGLVFEGHSTDYQSKERLREMVEDGIAILKVGPALTLSLIHI